MKADLQNLSLETLAVHAGQPPDPTTGAVMTPIVLASTFAQSAPGQHQGFEYSRSGNPTRQALERCVAALEGAKHGLAFSSGSGATATLLHCFAPGDHAILGDDVYGGTFRLFDKVMKPFGLEHTSVDMLDLKNIERALKPTTKLIWLETPTNPMLKVFDIQAISELAHKHGLLVVVDNTFASPVLQQPLALGADVVVHSTTKYMNGHSDVVGGVIATSNDSLLEKLLFHQNAIGAIPAPFDCYMVLRGLKTLPLRIRHATSTAGAIVSKLSGSSAVRKVYYPGLPENPGHAVAQKQMRGFGAMISFELAGGLPAARAFLSSLQIFSCAESLGGVESLAEHPAIMTHASIPAAARQALGISDGLVRLSIGVESAGDLWADIEQAMARTS